MEWRRKEREGRDDELPAYANDVYQASMCESHPDTEEGGRKRKKNEEAHASQCPTTVGSSKQ